VPSGAQLAEQVDHLDERLKFLLGRHLERLRQRLALVERFALFSDPAALVRQAGEALAGLEGRLARSVATHVQRCRDRIEALGRHLASVDAAAVLNRGYSYTTTADGRIVASVKDVGPGERITTRVADGSIESVVDATRPSE
jgi:exodeoxyribonuclease VII large subunit